MKPAVNCLLDSQKPDRPDLSPPRVHCPLLKLSMNAFASCHLQSHAIKIPRLPATTTHENSKTCCLVQAPFGSLGIERHCNFHLPRKRSSACAGFKHQSPSAAKMRPLKLRVPFSRLKEARKRSLCPCQRGRAISEKPQSGQQQGAALGAYGHMVQCSVDATNNNDALPYQTQSPNCVLLSHYTKRQNSQSEERMPGGCAEKKRSSRHRHLIAGATWGKA